MYELKNGYQSFCLLLIEKLNFLRKINETYLGIFLILFLWSRRNCNTDYFLLTDLDIIYVIIFST